MRRKSASCTANRLVFRVAFSACLLAFAAPARGGPTFVAYQVPAGTVGNQAAGVGLGMDFDVLLTVSVRRLGVFDSGSDGLAAPITVRLWDRDTQLEVTSLEFTPEDPGELVGGSRFKDLPAPLDLEIGFHGTIAAEGYGAEEPNGNQGEGPLALSTEAGNCSLFFVGSGRVADVPGSFPTRLDAGPPNRYAAGTFLFEALEEPGLSGGIAYNVPAGALGSQDFGGALGMDFDVRVDLRITSLGVFDSGSDGLVLPLTARLYNRLTRVELASLAFTPEDPGDLVDGSRLKELPSLLELPAGFQGTMVAEGYGVGEENGNAGVAPLDRVFDDGGCAITFVGTSRYGNAGAFPDNPDAGPANRYAAGTFEFAPSPVPVPRPNPPTGLTVEARDAQAILRWNAAAPGVPAVAGYNVFRTRPGALVRINEAPLAGTQLTLNNLLNGVEYCFVVASVSAGGIDSVFSAPACATPTGGLPTQTFIAFQVPEGTPGNQDAAVALGLDFQTNVRTVVTRLGVFDSGSDGLATQLTARLYDSATRAELTSLTFTPADPGTLEGGYRLKPLPVPIELPADFIGTIVGEGYGALEANGNENLGPIGVAFEDGTCSLTFLGARNGAMGAFPINFDPNTRYAAGTFEFGPPSGVSFPPQSGGVAYEVPTGATSTQEFGGGLGLDFNVLAPIAVTRLGAFDDGSDGLNLPITVRLWDRSTQAVLAEAQFLPEDPGELVGGSRFKPLDDLLILPEGFQGTIVGEGYGVGEGNGNGHGAAVLPWRVNDGGCLLEFVGSGRVATVAGSFPTALDGGPPNRYAAGTFEYIASTLEQPDPPINLTAQLSGVDAIDLAWQPPPGGKPLVGYNVYRRTPAPTALLTPTPIMATSFRVTDLLNGVEGCFFVRAVGVDASESKRSNEACASIPGGSMCAGCTIPYLPERLAAGNQEADVALGLDLDVLLDLEVTRLGAFDDNSDGFARPITVRLYDRDAQVELATIDFSPEDPGELVGGARFKPLETPLELPAGTHLTIVGEGYGPGERNGNLGLAAPPLIGTDTGECSTVELLGLGRYGPAGVFPGTVDNGPPHRFAAGTLELRALERPGAFTGGIAYIVPAGTVGNQAVRQPLGMDFDVLGDLRVTRLGVFDDGSDGLQLQITARIYDRATRLELASLVFAPGDDGELLGGSRFKALPEPLVLAAGFQGTIVAEGYGAAERNGNRGLGPIELHTSSGGCLLRFVGSSRVGNLPRQFPSRIDTGPADRYAAGTFEFEPAAPGARRLRRGDTDQNGTLQLTDAVQVLGYLFLGIATRVPDCLDAADTDDNGAVQLTDAVRILQFLFLGGAPPSPPFGDPGDPASCGLDPTDDGLDCALFDPCG